jgi:hypothetical protein
MEEVRAWINESSIPADLRGTSGVKDVEFSFCPGEGWLAARYIFTDLQDMIDFPDSAAFNTVKS